MSALFVASGAPLAAEIAACSGGTAAGFACQDIHLLAQMPLAEIGGGSGNDIWGWTDPATGREYALMGRSTGVGFIDVTEPENPDYLGDLASAAGSSPWRDIKVHDDHAFIVADAAGDHGMQVFSLARLRGVTTSTEFTADLVYDGFEHAHNLAINEETGFAYAVGTETCSGGLHMIDISQPLSPLFVGCFDGDGDTHDAQCVAYDGPDDDYRNREICFAANEDTVTIVDVTDKSDPAMVARVTYPEVGFVHQGWLTEDHRYYLQNDELDERLFGAGTRTNVWDVRDLDNPRLSGSYEALTEAIDHNLYVHDDFVFEANYRAGLRILKLGDLARGELEEIAFFDTYPDDDSPEFDGAWSVYPYFASGTIVVSDINRGLFVLSPDLSPIIFADDFESGTFSTWSRRVGSAVEIVEPGLKGSRFAATIDVSGGPTPAFLESRHPKREKSFTVSLLLDANRVDLGDGEVEFLRLVGKKKRPVAALTLAQTGDRYRVHAYASTRAADLQWVGSTKVPGGRPVALRLEWRRASGADATDGVLRLFRKKKKKADATDLESGTLVVNTVQLGLPSGVVEPAAAGAFVLDRFLSSPR